MSSDLPFPLSNATDVSDKHLAFRTITTMLADIPRFNPIDIQDNLWNEPDPAAREEVRVLDALSHLIVGEHDVAALATNRINFDGTKLRVIACVNIMPFGKVVSASPWSTLTTKLSKLCSSISRNWRKDHQTDNDIPPSLYHQPRIIYASQPLDLNGRNSLQYIKDLQTGWKKVELEQHLWIMGNLLSSQIGQNRFSVDLTRYVVAISYKRMIRRFNHEFLSMPFYTSLTNFSQSELANIGCKRNQQGSSKPGVDFPSISTPSNVPIDPRRARQKQREERNDMIFLKEVVPNFQFKTQIPKLRELAAVSSGAQNVQLYTNETSAEFHELLVELIDLFKTSLFKLDDSQRNQEKNIAEIVNAICRSGCALLRISRGRALQIHLENIQEALDDPRISIAGIEADPIANFEVIQGKTKVQAYTAWMRLLVSHFDAVEIVLAFFSKQHFRSVPISAAILAPPFTSRSQLSWETVFNRYLPQIGSKQRDCSNEDLMEFLKERINSAQEDAEIRDAIEKARESLGLTASINHAAFEAISKAKNVAIKEQGEILLKMVQINTDSLPSQADIFEKLEEIAGILGDPARDRFFLNLGQSRLFPGTIHCTTCLASLLPLDVSKQGNDIEGPFIEVSEMLKGFGRAIGVSKRCCPVCAKFLEFLARNSGQPFVIRGNHGTITPCTLPPWAPQRVVDQMIQYFARMLREDLVSLYYEYQDRNLARGRCKSTGSEPLSVHTTGERVNWLELDFW